MNIRKLVLLLLIVSLSVIVYGTYYFGTLLASDKLVSTVAKEIEKSGELEELKQALENDPELKKLIGDAETITKAGKIASAEEITAGAQSESNEEQSMDDQGTKQGAAQVADKALPFTTKEEATKVLIKKVGITKLQEMHTQVQEGTASNEEIITEVKKNLSEEEILALKVIAYKELSGE